MQWPSFAAHVGGCPVDKLGRLCESGERPMYGMVASDSSGRGKQGVGLASRDVGLCGIMPAYQSPCPAAAGYGLPLEQVMERDGAPLLGKPWPEHGQIKRGWAPAARRNFPREVSEFLFVLLKLLYAEQHNGCDKTFQETSR